MRVPLWNIYNSPVPGPLVITTLKVIIVMCVINCNKPNNRNNRKDGSNYHKTKKLNNHCNCYNRNNSNNCKNRVNRNSINFDNH